jgi:hypothetical protein
MRNGLAQLLPNGFDNPGMGSPTSRSERVSNARIDPPSELPAPQ